MLAEMFLRPLPIRYSTVSVLSDWNGYSKQNISYHTVLHSFV